jgi:hypothetical protein
MNKTRAIADIVPKIFQESCLATWFVKLGQNLKLSHLKPL